MLEAPPREYWEKLSPSDTIIAVGDGLYHALRNGTLEFVLQRMSDQLDDSDFARLKAELDRGNSLVTMMMRKRIRFGLTGPVEDHNGK